MDNDKQPIKKNLLLITNHFPFGVQEPFLRHELEYLKKYFTLTVVTTDCTSPLSSGVGHDFPVYRIKIHSNFFVKICFILISLTKKFVWKEIILIIREKRDILAKLQTSLYNVISAISFYHHMKRLKLYNSQDLIYSYWHNYKVLSMGLLLEKNNLHSIPIVSRIHGYDLFNERVDVGNRQAFKAEMDSHLSNLFFSSRYGKNYYETHFGFSKGCNYSVAYLGVEKSDTVTLLNPNFGLSIISVSNVIPLKRIDLIIDALGLIKDFTVDWVHFGTGSSMDNLNKFAEERLGEMGNISYRFGGQIRNSDLREYYKNNNIDVFITTSSSEGGCPVSVQEAFSFGIPSICSDVGGLTEMIEDGGSGYLLPEFSTPEMIKNILLRMYSQKQTGKLEEMKRKAYKTWEEQFNAEKNYEFFATELHKIAR